MPAAGVVEELSWTSDSDMNEDAYDTLDDDQVLKGCFPIHSRRPNAHGGLHSHPNSTLQPLSNRLQKFDARIRAAPLEEWEGRWNIDMSNSVITSIREFVREGAIGRTKTKDKADRATVEKAIDPKTRMLLIKVLKAGPDDKINGCIATGKEANVYHATKSDGQELAIKVYKTSVLDFKDRDRYVQGDRRYRKGYCKHNPREMVKVWAEKEKRNLERMVKNGIRCPTALDIKDHVLVMEFIGKAGWPAPRLKDAALSLDKLRKGYREIADHLRTTFSRSVYGLSMQDLYFAWILEELEETLEFIENSLLMIIAMRMLYQKAKLVHADLSEYNILYFEGHLYIIDVSQAVEPDHVHANEFLCRDCVHVSDFFKKKGVAVMAIRELFDFIVDPCIADEAVDSHLDEVQQKVMARGVISAEDEIADSVFVQSFIPRTLEHVKNVEADVIRITNGDDTEDMYYKTITGLEQALIYGVQVAPPETESDSGIDEENSSDSDSSSGISTQDPLEKKIARKENKKKVKEEKREARKHKLPKAVKKRKKKLSKPRKTR